MAKKKLSIPVVVFDSQRNSDGSLDKRAFARDWWSAVKIGQKRGLSVLCRTAAKVPYDQVLASFPPGRGKTLALPTAETIQSVFPVVVTRLQELMKLEARNVIRLSFTGVSAPPKGESKTFNLKMYVLVEGKPNQDVEKGLLLYYLTRAYLLPFAYLCSSKVTFRRVRARIFKTSASVNAGDPIRLEQLQQTEDIMLPCGIRGLGVGAAPNPLLLNFEIFVAGREDDRFDSFGLIGCRLSSDDELYGPEGGYVDDVVRIKDLFLNETPVYRGPDPADEFKNPQFKGSLLGVTQGGELLSPIVGFGVSGFRKVAGMNAGSQNMGGTNP